MGLAPRLDHIAPTTAPRGDLTLDVYGSGFLDGAVVLLNASETSPDCWWEQTTTVLAAGHIQAVGGFGSANTWYVYVRNPDGQESNRLPFVAT